MRRRSARDPRSALELRRLAFKAQRSAAAREVLLDALLESDKRTEEFMRYTREAAKRNGVKSFLLYTPPNSWLRSPKASNIKDRRVIVRGRFDLSDTRTLTKSHHYSGAVIVYVVEPPAAR